MKLLIDAGNTRLKWGLHADGRWLQRQSLPTGEALRLAEQRAAWGEVDGVLACSVAGSVVEASIVAALGPLADRLRWCRSGALHAGGIVNGYQQPNQLGADRWAAMIGAWSLVGDDCLVVCAGTATTIDLLQRQRADAAGDLPTADFLGGVILPGLTLMRLALARNTAALPLAAGSWREQPRNTDDAIETGCLEAQAGAIERLARRLPAGAVCVLSGGAADALAPHLDLPLRRVDELVLEGLARLAAETPVLS